MPTVHLERDLQELFRDLHESGHFPDGKVIADAVLKASAESILAAYRAQRDDPGFDLIAFFRRHFEVLPPGSSGYQSDPNRSVQEHIELLWEVLSRAPDRSEQHSTLVPLPHPYVVPGGRFNEIYYWDSYFTMLGLQVSGKADMIGHMVDNFAWMIDRFGFIPNGNRSYFLSRSQPPFFAKMVRLLAEERGDKVLGKYLPAMEKEYAFWMREPRLVESGSGPMNRYYDEAERPRAEMYSDDAELIEDQGEAGRRTLLDIRAACESGWDFSSRWFRDPNRLDTIHTTDILPVDLNCLLYGMEKTLSQASEVIGDREAEERYHQAADLRHERIQALFWNDRSGYFHDYDFQAGTQTESLSLAGAFPLFFRIASTQQAEQCAEVLEYRFLRDGGLISTCHDSGQQWDAPNGWAPLQWIAIQGLRYYGFDKLADRIRQRWIDLNVKVYRSTGKLMEKYNVVDTNLESGGGEYPVQDGFGWTNGVLLRLLSEDQSNEG